MHLAYITLAKLYNENKISKQIRINFNNVGYILAKKAL